ncbi:MULTISPECIES: hypothetical protein [Prochlorococcus]|uniref:hypothetical protein n=1 Tax=Prochlorococcus TaxID=1218 RepID=UPI0005339F89|nr:MULTISPECIES: hypothetical protein [Prochlorococcus]KGG12794.1 hypothetical protein EV05_0465 [Prochlorococcus sp. MIT 0601]
MYWKEKLIHEAYEWWKNHRKIITFSAVLIIFGWYINPVIKQARIHNEKEKSIWLIIHSSANESSFSAKIEMKGFPQCQEQGRRWRSPKRSYLREGNRSFICLEGK